MSQPFVKPGPLFLSQSPRSSGDVFTGELLQVRGGGRAAAIWSGALNPNLTACPSGAVASGAHVCLYAGAGRLNSLMLHTQMVSGAPAFFYDAGAITLSGTSVSGQKIIGVIPTTFAAGNPAGALVSGASIAMNTAAPWNGQPLNVDMPFNSGLCVSCPSGTPGFTVSYTCEVSTAFTNP